MTISDPIRRNINGIRHYQDPTDRAWVPSVTSIISKMMRKDGLDAWKSRNVNHKAYASNEATLGSLKHLRILQQYCDEQLEAPELPSLDWCTEGRMDQLELAEIMWEKLGLKFGWPRYIEHTLYRGEYPRCAGSLDWLVQVEEPVKWEDGLTLGDIKSSKAPQEGHKVQLGAYYLLLPEHLRPRRGVITYLHTQMKNNLTLEPVVIEMGEKDLVRYGNKFLDLAGKFYETKVKV